MLNKIKNIISKTDNFLYKKFGSDKSTKALENIKEARIIFSYLNEPGKETNVRFVGGCVRKAISGEKIDDIDLATTLSPKETKQRLINQNIQVIETGIAHGTITAILNNKKFEITTLRKDISTDGRHANVQFTSDWEDDANRRDFTINAMYSDIEGRIFDPLNGISDLKNGIIKFIGSSEQRIKEDYLRILRYFRFFTQYSKIKYDADTLQSIKRNINGLNKISNERIFDELKKILKLKNIYSLFSNKNFKIILLNIFPQFIYYKRLSAIYQFNHKIISKYDIDLILSLLIVDGSNNYEYFCHKYKTSNNTKNRMKNISENFKNIQNKKFLSEENIKKLIYTLGKKSVNDLLLFSAGMNAEKNLNLETLLNFVDDYKVPKFHISGDDLKKYGYETGIILGKKLKSLEKVWIENNFVLDEKMLQKTLDKMSKN